MSSELRVINRAIRSSSRHQNKQGLFNTSIAAFVRTLKFREKEDYLVPMADSDPLPVYELHDSAALPAGQELLREEKPSSRSVDQIEQVVAAHKEPTGTRFTEFDLFRHGWLFKPRTTGQNAEC